MKKQEQIELEQLKSGSVKAFDYIYHCYSGKLYNYLLKFSKGNVYLSEEIVQRVFIKIWEHRTEIDTSKSFGAFLSTMAHNMLMNSYNHETVEYVYKEFILKIHSEEADATVEKEIEHRFLEQYLNKLIDQLPSAQRQVYVLSRLEHFSNKQIAEKLNKSVSTVEKQLSQAHKSILRQLLQHYDKIFMFLLGISFQ